MYDSFVCVTWLQNDPSICVAWLMYDLFICVAHLYVWLVCMWHTDWCMTDSYQWHDSLICVTRRIHNTTYASHDSFLCVPWLIHVCAMTHSHVWHDAFTTQLIRHMTVVSHIWACRVIYIHTYICIYMYMYIYIYTLLRFIRFTTQLVRRIHMGWLYLVGSIKL